MCITKLDCVSDFPSPPTLSLSPNFSLLYSLFSSLAVFPSVCLFNSLSLSVSHFFTFQFLFLFSSSFTLRVVVQKQCIYLVAVVDFSLEQHSTYLFLLEKHFRCQFLFINFNVRCSFFIDGVPNDDDHHQPPSPPPSRFTLQDPIRTTTTTRKQTHTAQLLARDLCGFVYDGCPDDGGCYDDPAWRRRSKEHSIS